MDHRYGFSVSHTTVLGCLATAGHGGGFRREALELWPGCAGLVLLTDGGRDARTAESSHLWFEASTDVGVGLGA